MPKFFVDYEIKDGMEEITLKNEDIHHITRVLRIKQGEEIIVTDCKGNSYSTILPDDFHSNSFLQIKEKKDVCAESSLYIKVFQGLPKHDKFEKIIQESVELGASEITPVICRRSIPRFRDDKDIRKKLERWNKISLAAAKQSGRSLVPEIMPPVSFVEAVKLLSENDYCFIPWESEENFTIKDYFKGIIKDSLHNAEKDSKNNEPSRNKEEKTRPSIAFLIGPEGGLDSDEIDFAIKSDIKTVTLGPGILRTQTAAPAVLSMILYEFDL